MDVEPIQPDRVAEIARAFERDDVAIAAVVLTDGDRLLGQLDADQPADEVRLSQETVEGRFDIHVPADDVAAIVPADFVDPDQLDPQLSNADLLPYYYEESRDVAEAHDFAVELDADLDWPGDLSWMDDPDSSPSIDVSVPVERSDGFESILDRYPYVARERVDDFATGGSGTDAVGPGAIPDVPEPPHSFEIPSESITRPASAFYPFPRNTVVYFDLPYLNEQVRTKSANAGFSAGVLNLGGGLTQAPVEKVYELVDETASRFGELAGAGFSTVAGFVTLLTGDGEVHRTSELEGERWLIGVVTRERIGALSELSPENGVVCYFKPKTHFFNVLDYGLFTFPVLFSGTVVPRPSEVASVDDEYHLRARAGLYLPEKRTLVERLREVFGG